jgi:hypothetical protein
MPRDLTDLMERAASFAPPEPYAAGDITRTAARRQRRRTTLIVGGAALTVMVVAGLAVGVAQHRPTTPEPSGQLLHDQTVDVSSAVAAKTLPGFSVEPWTIPSIQHLGAGYADLPTYRDVDADGRLIVVTAEGARHRLLPRLYDRPGQSPRPWHQPPSPGRNGTERVEFQPSFLSDGRVLWSPSVPIFSSKNGIHVTDLDGGNDVFVRSDQAKPWVVGDSRWYTGFDRVLRGEGGALEHSLYTAPFNGKPTKVAGQVAVADVEDGEAVWVTTDGEVMAESAVGGSARQIRVPLSPGCRMPQTQVLQNAVGDNYLAVNRSMIALTEACGDAKNLNLELLVFDLTGHTLVHVTGGAYALDPSLGTDAVVFDAVLESGSVVALRYDLVTGLLAQLSDGGTKQQVASSQAAGDYVLWYDRTGGHVGRFR